MPRRPAAEDAGDRAERTHRYHSPLRARQAAATRRAIVDAGLELFAEHGWAATTLPAVAERAGVSVDTIYATFGNKSSLFMAVVDVAIVGDDEAAAMADRPDFATLGVGRRADRLRTGVRYTLAVYERSVPILRTLREAAASDDAARARLEQYDRDRRDLIAAGMALILARAPSEDVVDSIWALISPEAFSYLRDGRGWTLRRIEDRFVDLLRTLVGGR